MSNSLIAGDYLPSTASTGVMGWSVSTGSRPPRLNRSAAASIRFPHSILTSTGFFKRLTALITVRALTLAGNHSTPQTALPVVASTTRNSGSAPILPSSRHKSG